MIPLHKKIVVLFFLSTPLMGCSDNPTPEERLQTFKQSLATKTCETLAWEKAYQRQIQSGIQARQVNPITVADVGATALTLGYNVVDNSLHGDARDSRLQEISEKIKEIELAETTKGCPQ